MCLSLIDAVLKDGPARSSPVIRIVISAPPLARIALAPDTALDPTKAAGVRSAQNALDTELYVFRAAIRAAANKARKPLRQHRNGAPVRSSGEIQGAASW